MQSHRHHCTQQVAKLDVETTDLENLPNRLEGFVGQVEKLKQKRVADVKLTKYT